MAATNPIQSMTGYASASRDLAVGRVGIELRSINSRFLDLVFRIPEELRAAEPGLRELITGAIARGKVECRVTLQKLPDSARPPTIDGELVARLVAVANDIGKLSPASAPLSVADLMRWPGVMADAAADPEAAVRELLGLGKTAIADLTTSRAREGSKLVQTILDRAQRMSVLVSKLESDTPALLATFEHKLVERLRAALVDATTGSALPVDEAMDRIRQEVVLYGIRIDVAEELSRLAVHIDELRRIVGGTGPVGKRLDFLMQELNREANTLGSKAANIDLTHSAVDLKLLIEQIREQVQNLE